MANPIERLWEALASAGLKAEVAARQDNDKESIYALRDLVNRAKVAYREMFTNRHEVAYFTGHGGREDQMLRNLIKRSPTLMAYIDPELMEYIWVYDIPRHHPAFVNVIKLYRSINPDTQWKIKEIKGDRYFIFETEGIDNVLSMEEVLKGSVHIDK